MKTLVQYEVKVLGRGLWTYVTTDQRARTFEDIKAAREALSKQGFKFDYSVSRVSPNEVYFLDTGDVLAKAVLIK